MLCRNETPSPNNNDDRQKKIMDNLPLSHASVIAINTFDGGVDAQNPDGGQREPAPEVFNNPGLRVKIRDDSQYAYQENGPGTVQNQTKPGWVSVKFDTGKRDQYRIGLPNIDGGVRDLELIEPPPPTQTATIVDGGRVVEVAIPKGLELCVGDDVLVVGKTMTIVEIAPPKIGGKISYVRRVIDAQYSEVDCDSAVVVVSNGKFDNIEKGDRVVLNSSGHVIVYNMGKEDSAFNVESEINVTWDQIGGLVEAKRQMIEAVELPHRHPEIFKFYHKKPTKGILLYGPPGCGKTLLGKAIANSLASIYAGKEGAKQSTGFIYVKGPEILDKFVGVSEATIRQIFQRAKKHKETFGYPAVVFIDEADAIFRKRGSGVSSDVESTIVPTVLTEMDGMEDSGALVILATNRPDILDPALVRAGRIDRKIKIERPTPESTVEIFMLNLKHVPLSNGFTVEDLAKLGSEQLFSDERVLYEIKTKTRGKFVFTLGDVVNGGMIANIVDQATSIALRRDLEVGGEPQGLKKEDLIAAVDSEESQNRDLNHTDELNEFTHDFKDDLVEVTRLRQAR